MSNNEPIGYKRIFGIILPSWVTEKMVRLFVAEMLCVVAMLFVLILLIRPKYEQISKLEDKLKNDKLALQNLRQSNDGISNMNSVLSKEEIESVMLAMPLEYSPERAIFVLRQIAADTGASIVSYILPPGTLVESSDSKLNKESGKAVDFMSYVIKIVISAPVEQLQKFISKVESSVPFGLVSDMNLQEVTKLSKSSNGKSVQISLELKYFQPKVNNINISKIETLTDKNLESARKLVGYNLFVVPENTSKEADVNTENTEGLFGF